MQNFFKPKIYTHTKKTKYFEIFHHSKLVTSHTRFSSGGKSSTPRKNSLPKNTTLNPGTLVPHPVVRPNNRHSLDVPGPESVKEGQVVSEALTNARDQRMHLIEQQRDAEDGERGSVVVRYNEASVHTADIDYDDVDDDVDEAATTSKNAKDFEDDDNSAIESSDNENSNDEKDSHSGAEINSASSESTGCRYKLFFKSRVIFSLQMVLGNNIYL